MSEEEKSVPFFSWVRRLFNGGAAVEKKTTLFFNNLVGSSPKLHFFFLKVLSKQKAIVNSRLV